MEVWRGFKQDLYLQAYFEIPYMLRTKHNFHFTHVFLLFPGIYCSIKRDLLQMDQLLLSFTVTADLILLLTAGETLQPNC